MAQIVGCMDGGKAVQLMPVAGVSVMVLGRPMRAAWRQVNER